MNIHIPGTAINLRIPTPRGGGAGRTEHAPSQRYKMTLWVVGIAFVAILVWVSVDNIR